VVFSKAEQSVMALKHGLSIICLTNSNVMPKKKRTSLFCTYGNQYCEVTSDRQQACITYHVGQVLQLII
jgi:hypothetical protein